MAFCCVLILVGLKRRRPAILSSLYPQSICLSAWSLEKHFSSRAAVLQGARAKGTVAVNGRRVASIDGRFSALSVGRRWPLTGCSSVNGHACASNSLFGGSLQERPLLGGPRDTLWSRQWHRFTEDRVRVWTVGETIVSLRTGSLHTPHSANPPPPSSSSSVLLQLTLTLTIHFSVSWWQLPLTSALCLLLAFTVTPSVAAEELCPPAPVEDHSNRSLLADQSVVVVIAFTLRTLAAHCRLGTRLAGDRELCSSIKATPVPSIHFTSRSAVSTDSPSKQLPPNQILCPFNRAILPPLSLVSYPT